MGDYHCCPWWFCFTFDNFIRRLFQRPEQILAPYFQEGMTALDLGCGMGFCSIPLARMVGRDGVVIAVDLQPQMLDGLSRRARRAGVMDRITPRLAAADDIKVTERVDFALAMWMAHEVKDKRKFLVQVRQCLKPKAKFLVIEPKWHVRKRDFQMLLELAKDCGYVVSVRPKIGLSRAAVLEPADG